jgi:serine/threonine protein kinase
MGEVYRARDRKLGRDVAVKVLSDALSAQHEGRARFDREARSLAALNHPGIVTIYAIEEIEGRQLITMEYVEGRPLSELIPKQGFPLDRFLAIAVQVTNAVAAAHKHGIVHRDLKPANVIIGAQDRVKVLDFGLAKLREQVTGGAETALPAREITGDGRIVGTVAYMSPEQAEGRPVDERSDVFSLGVLLYEMASGERPFKGDTSLSVLSSILKDSPRALGEVNPALPRDLSRYVKRCLVKDPDGRYQSAIDLRNDLEDLRQSLVSGELAAPVTVRPSSLSSRAVVVAASLVIVALAGVAWTWSNRGGVASITTPPSMTFSRLTMIEGTATAPHVSPDGKWAVFVSGVSGNNDIYLQSTTGQTSFNLTKDSPVGDGAPAFSPDGELIAFQSARDGGGLFVMGRMGESVRRLTRTGFHPAWFPDGKQIVFTSLVSQFAETRGPGVSEMWVVDVAGGEPRRLFSGDSIHPQVSPSGRRIAYWGLPLDANGAFAGANRDIWTIAADGSSPVRVTTDDATDWNPVWSPDGRWLYYLSDRKGSMNLWRIAIDEATGVTRGEPQALTAPAAYIRSFSVSADGLIGTFATLTQTSNLARAPFNARTAVVTGAVEAMTTGPRDFQLIDVAPDGKDIVLQTSFRTQEDLYLLTVGGTGLRNLTNDRPRDRAPRWQNARQLLFYSDRAVDNYELWSIDRDGGSLRQLTKSGGQRFYPLPSRDGTKVAAADITAWTLFVYDGSDFSKPARELPSLPIELRSGAFIPTDWSPDGRQLIGGTASGIWVYSFASNSFRRLAVGLGGSSAPMWLDDRRIITATQGRVVVVDSVTGSISDVLAIAGETLISPKVSADGYLYFLRGSQSGDIWTVRFDAAADPALTK